MKILISINSCIKFALNGSNQALRDTFLSDIGKYPELEYKFFMGDGTSTGEDESVMRSCIEDCPPRFKNLEETPITYSPQHDEVLVPSPDDYIHLPWKVRESLRWSCKRDYDYIFKCFADTYVNFDRLLNSGFEKHDYIGRWYGGYAVGGSGYWLSRKAAQIVAASPVTDWSEDRWVGRRVLQANEVLLHGDQRYGASPPQNPAGPHFPQPDNDLITAHLSESPMVYSKDLMYEAHRRSGK